MGIWLVHAVGEADLMLEARGPAKRRRERIAGRVELVRQALDAGDRRRVREYLVGGKWEMGATRQLPPLTAGLELIAQESPRPDVNVVLIGTRQEPADPLDTVAVAELLGRELRAHGQEWPVAPSRVEVVITPSLREGPTLELVALCLPVVEPASADEGAVTWGSGPTRLALAAISALASVGLPWRLVGVSPDGVPARWLDPTQDLPVDPVAAILLRWRMFASLERLAGELGLDDRQQIVVRELAGLWRDGLCALSVPALRSLVADAVVRRDGTAGIAVRRYVEKRHADLVERERASGRDAGSLYEAARREARQNRRGPNVTLGPILGAAKRLVATDPWRQRQDLDSVKWLTDDVVDKLNTIGVESSHRLESPPPSLVRQVQSELAADEASDRLMGVGLPAAPRTPQLRVFLAWAAGLEDSERPADIHRATVGRKFLTDEFGVLVRHHLDVRDDRESIDVTALVVGTTKSREAAVRQAAEFTQGGQPAAVAGREVDLLIVPDELATDEDRQRWVEERVTAAVPEDTGIVVMVGPGWKVLALPMLTALRRVAAVRGIPFVLREMSGREGPEDNHLWPALHGGDWPLLVAAREALEALELDVAWRLLAATGITASLGERCRRLTVAFTCRGTASHAAQSRPRRAAGTGGVRQRLNDGLMADRIRLVQRVLGRPAEAGAGAERVRLLMLAACAVEVSVDNAGTFRKQLRDRAKDLADIAAARDAAVLLALNEARDRAPITHGEEPNPDRAVRDAVTALIAAGTVSPSLGMAGTVWDVPSLVDSAASAAERLCSLPRDAGISLVSIHQALVDELGVRIAEWAERYPRG